MGSGLGAALLGEAGLGKAVACWDRKCFVVSGCLMELLAWPWNGAPALGGEASWEVPSLHSPTS